MIIVVTGPTGVGKTKLSIKLAKILNGEIINADSMQIYKELNVGTAKIKPGEKEGIKHHLLDIKDVTEDYSVYDYQKDGRYAISDVLSRNKIPIIVGGTGYYIKSLLYDYTFKEEDSSKEYPELTNEEIYQRILELDPSALVDSNNRRRSERLLCKLESDNFIVQKNLKLFYDDVKIIGLTTDTDNLYNIINKRVDGMLIDLIDEVKGLYLRNIHSKSVNTGIGYKELYPFFENKKSLKECVNDIKQNSRNYAKRQYTYLNNQLDVKWFKVDYENFKNTIEEVYNYILGDE